MRRLVAAVGALTFIIGLAGAPARADHCGAGNITTCPDPLVVLIAEGVGNVCAKAAPLLPTLADKTNYGTKCTYNYNDPSWASKSQSEWNQTGGADGSKYQGLFWPGVGPGGLGPYGLKIGGPTAAPNNLCVSSVGGPGCSSLSIGKLFPGEVNGIGAHCGSSHGAGRTEFRAADGSLISYGTLAWSQSAATILPLFGETLTTIKGNTTTTYPAGQRPQVRGLTSSRGVGGAGNCGITDPTTGFQVEGMLVTY